MSAEPGKKEYTVTIPNPRQKWNPHGEQLNKDFAESNAEFRLACDDAKIPPTTRQASKWRNKRGLAYMNKYKKSE
jgi:hypothetical protein